MEAVAKVPVDLEPHVDERALHRSINQIGKAIRSAKPGTSHIGLSKQVANVLQTLMSTGQFTTPAQAERYMRLFTGGNYSATGMSIWAHGTSIARAAQKNPTLLMGSFSEKRIAQMRPDLAGAAGAYNNLAAAYLNFKSTPTEHTRNELLGAIEEVKNVLVNISKERKANTKTFSKIEKATQTIGKEALNFKTVTTPSPATAALGAVKFLKGGLQGLLKILGIGSLIGAAKKWIDFGISGIKEGSDDLTEQAMYGSNRNIAIGRTRAKMYGLDESITSAPERYALDFRQRMMWGEVSDKEWIALSRMGTLGQKIVSGEAARDPKAFQKEIENYIAANRGNEAEIRQMLSWLGWSPQLMKYGAIQYSEEDTERLEGAYAENIKAQKDAAVLVWKTANEFDKYIADLRAATASMLGAITSSPESRMRLGYSWGLSGYSNLERGIVKRSAEELAAKRANPTYWNTRPYFSDFLHASNEDWIKGRTGINRLSAEDVAYPEITNYNNFYINGGNSKEVTDAVQNGLYPARVAPIMNETGEAH